MAISALIHDEEGRSLLDTIDEIRQLARIPQQIELPQIIVVGQQSSGKSSVLRAVSRIPFPTESGLCTQFAIEICCRRSDENRITARIGPLGDVDPDKARRLDAFAHQWAQASIDTEDKVRLMIDEARIAIGLQADTGHSYDRLVVEVEGPSQEHLTIIDLPGLISAGGEEQIREVDGLVDRYLRGEHTIILAVIHGFADGRNQRIFDLIPEYWRRAIGVITAADMVDWTGNGAKGIKHLVSSSSTHRPRYGWHIVRNLDSKETRLGLDRDKVEHEFFSSKIDTPGWTGMERVLYGIEPLRQKLSKTLKELIASFLPEMLNQVESGAIKSKAKLQTLGDERSNLVQQRAYLTEKAGVLRDKIRGALEGRADALEIAFDGVSLRDKVRNANEEFAEEMFNNGHTWSVESEDVIEDLNNADPSYQNDPRVPLKTKGTAPFEPYAVSKKALLDYFTQVISHRQGRALRGTFDPVWVGTFFLQQSHKWRDFVKLHTERVFEIVSDEIKSSVDACVNEDTAKALWEQIFRPELRHRHENLKEKTQELLTPYTTQYPTTLNRSYTRTLLRTDQKAQGRSSAREHADETDLQLQAGAHIYRCMDSYYCVAINVLLDNVQSLGIENALLKGLENIFLPESLGSMDAKKIADFAAESSETADERKELVAMISDFEQAKGIILKERSRSFAAVTNSPSPRSRNRSSVPSQRGQGSMQPATLSVIRSSTYSRNANNLEELDGSHEVMPHYHRSSHSDNVTGVEGQKVKSKGKQRQSKALLNNGSRTRKEDDVDDDAFAGSSIPEVAQQA